MATTEGRPAIAAIKDADTERPIPTDWRATIRAIVGALVRNDYHLTTTIAGVAPMQPETALQIEDYIKDYGEEIIELPEEAWDTSVCIWSENRWIALIDLWTRSEGQSDLALNLHVSPSPQGVEFTIHMVYVP